MQVDTGAPRPGAEPEAPSAPDRAPGGGDTRSYRRAHRLLWLTIALFLVGFGVGTAWDRAWHATHPFEDFWSPPHLFIYAMHGLAMGVAARLALAPELRACFGPLVRLPLLPVRVPGSIALFGGGFVVILAAGLFDSIWHARFGLDETTWSFPHAMLGWGILLALLGLVSARLALRPRHPLAWPARLLFGLLLLTTPVGIILGPLGNHNTPEVARAIAALPVLAGEPDAQRTYRIYQEWNLTRLHPLFVPLAALASGVGLALVRSLHPRWWFLLTVAVLAAALMVGGERRAARFFGLEADARTWLPVPYLAAALALVVLRAARLGDRWAWAGGGVAFGLLAARFWGQDPLLILPAALALVVGAHLGARIFDLLERPTARGVTTLVGLLGVGIPATLGVVDLWLRAHTP